MMAPAAGYCVCLGSYNPRHQCTTCGLPVYKRDLERHLQAASYETIHRYRVKSTVV